MEILFLILLLLRFGGPLGRVLIAMVVIVAPAYLVERLGVSAWADRVFGPGAGDELEGLATALFVVGSLLAYGLNRAWAHEARMRKRRASQQAAQPRVTRRRLASRAPPAPEPAPTKPRMFCGLS